jgi:hypothetical protein
MSRQHDQFRRRVAELLQLNADGIVDTHARPAHSRHKQRKATALREEFTNMAADALVDEIDALRSDVCFRGTHDDLRSLKDNLALDFDVLDPCLKFR